MRPTNSHLRSRAIALALVLLIALAGCGDGDEPAQPGKPEDAAPSWSDLPVLGASFDTNVDEAVRLLDERHESQQRAVVECMNEKGYEHQASPSNNRPFVLSNMPRAATENDAKRRGLNVTETRQAAFEYNTSSNGPLAKLGSGSGQAPGMAEAAARAEAARTCTSTLGDDLGAGNDLVDSYQREVMSDPALVNAQQDWTQCMTRQGYTAPSLIDLANSDLVRGNPEGLGYDEWDGARRSEFDRVQFSIERDAALAQVTCDREVYFPILGEWAELERVWLDENAFQLREADPRFGILIASYVGI